MLMSTSERPQAGTTNSQPSLLALDIPNSANRDSPVLMSGAVNSLESQRQSQTLPLNEPTPSRLVTTKQSHNEETEEERNRLGVPAPITKNQPSWDPLNATPIAEEGFPYENRPKQPPQTMHSAGPPKLFATPDDAGSRSERSNSGDAHFYDAAEEPSDLNDWVMVSPEPEAKQSEPKEPTERPVSFYKPSEEPPPAFLERQRTRDAPALTKVATPEDQPPSLPFSQQQVQRRVESSPRPDSEVYQPPEGPPPSFLARQQTRPAPELEILQRLEQTFNRVNQLNAEPKPIPKVAAAREIPSTQSWSPEYLQNKAEPEVIRSSQEPAPSVLNRPRFSYEASTQSRAAPTYEPNASPYSLSQQNFVHSAREQQFQQGLQEPARNDSFKGLPPIRRTSTFGLGFGRKSKPRFPIDDEDELASPQSQHEADLKNYESEIGAAAGAAAVAAYANQHENEPSPQHQLHHTRTSSTNLAQQRRDSIDQSGSIRPELNQVPSSDYSQRMVNSAVEAQPEFQAPHAADVPQEVLRSSQDLWRPNVASPPAQTSPVRYGGTTMAPPPRPSLEQQRSMEGQRTRGFSGSSETATRTDVQHSDDVSRFVQSPPSRPMLYDQPPSSAQRYPELFQTQQQPLADLGRDGDLPSHMYQAPIPREAAFLPRQQTNEYQLPGVGPPTEELRPERARRSSGSFLKDLGGRISRGTSRERGNSISRDVGQDGGMSPTRRQMESRDEYPESSIASDEAQVRQKRRSSFFGNLNRASTTGLDPPQSRESVVAHFPGSRTDLLGTPSQSPIDTPDRKKSFFGTASPSSPKVKSNKLTRSSTSGMSDEPGKKKRFSGLSSMFSRTGNPSSRDSVQDRAQATRELSYNERQPIESPQPDQRQAVRQLPPPQNRNQDSREANQPRHFLSKLPSTGDTSKSSQDGKGRRPSAANLLSGFMGRKSEQKDRGKEDSSSQGTIKQSSQPTNPQQMPLGQTYSDLRDESPIGQPYSRTQQPQPTRYAEQPPQPQQTPQERGRRASREPQRQVQRNPVIEPRYDTVPIPGGYSLVRGQGAMVAPTDYDPRGLSRFQQGQQVDTQQQHPGLSQQLSYGQGPPRQNSLQQAPHHPQPEARRTSQGIQSPGLSAIESNETYAKHSSPRLSREDLLARSPAREQLDQQRPYQLSLPEDEEDRDSRPMSLSKSPPIISPPSSTRSPPLQSLAQPRKQHDAIQRLQQPILRHPESPAGYPLPDDAFSPINEAARDLPPPPPPKWPSHLDAQHGHNPNQHISTQHLTLIESELDRSNTRRTAVSAVSGMSGPQSAGLHVPDKADEGGRDGITPSPTPPSPAYTPEREASPPPPDYDEKELERGLSASQDRGRRLEDAHQSRGNQLLGDQNIRTTVLDRGPSPDLYNASPRLVQNSNGMGNGASLSIPAPRNVAQTSGSENASVLAKAKTKAINTGQGLNEHSGIHARRAVNAPINTSLGNSVNTGTGERDAREEKIYYDAETGEEGHADEGEGLTMSATSYPGQE